MSKNRGTFLLLLAVLIGVSSLFQPIQAEASHRDVAPQAQVQPNIPPYKCEPNRSNTEYKDDDGYVWSCRCIRKGKFSRCMWVLKGGKAGVDDLTALLYLWGSRDQGIDTEKALLTMQADGNLVVYDENGNARWATSTVGAGSYAKFQTDGNFVVYNSADRPVWSSRTCCHLGNILRVQGDGNVVVANAVHTPLWSTRTNH